MSARQVEDITEVLWGTKVPLSTVSKLNQEIHERIERWRNHPLHGEYHYVFLDGIVVKRSWAGEVRNVSVLVAIAVNREGYREMIGVAKGARAATADQ